MNGRRTQKKVNAKHIHFPWSQSIISRWNSQVGWHCEWNQIRANVGGWINDNEWLFASCCSNKAGEIWDVSEVCGNERTRVSPRQMRKFLNWLSKLDTRQSSSYSLSRVRIVGVYRRWSGQHDRVDVKGRWHLGMSGNGEGEGVIRDCVKRGWSACGVLW